MHWTVTNEHYLVFIKQLFLNFPRSRTNHLTTGRPTLDRAPLILRFIFYLNLFGFATVNELI